MRQKYEPSKNTPPNRYLIRNTLSEARFFRFRRNDKARDWSLSGVAATKQFPRRSGLGDRCSKGKQSVASLLFLGIFLFFFVASPCQGEIATDPLFNLDYADIFAEILPSLHEADVIAVLYLECNGSDPVVLKLDGNFKKMRITSDWMQTGYVYHHPYFTFTNLTAGSRVVTFEYTVEHSGLASSGAIISESKLDLGVGSFWYPRNVASDTHQVQLNVVTPENFILESNGELVRDVPNNFKRLRTIILSKPLAEGLTLKSNKP